MKVSERVSNLLKSHYTWNLMEFSSEISYALLFRAQRSPNKLTFLWADIKHTIRESIVIAGEYICQLTMLGSLDIISNTIYFGLWSSYLGFLGERHFLCVKNVFSFAEATCCLASFASVLYATSHFNLDSLWYGERWRCNVNWCIIILDNC